MNSAWMVGDTPDDLRSARAAGVVSLGIAAPSDNPSEAKRLLAAAGAAMVVDTLERWRVSCHDTHCQ